MKRPARLLNLPAYPFARWAGYVQEARSRGDDVIRLDIGDPDKPPPGDSIEALCLSARKPDRHGYPGYRGLPPLRQAVAEYYQRRFSVELDSDTQIVTLLGSKEGIVNLSLACLDPDDLVLVPDPGYAPYSMGAALAGAKAFAFQLLPECGFLPNLASIPRDVADRAVLMWLNYPNNPTGATADQAFFAEAVEFARRHSLLLCHDAPYCDVAYDGYVPGSLLQVPGASEVAIEFNSLSKTFNMPGWRLGMAAGNEEALSALAQVKSNVDSGIFRPMQDAAVRALSADPAWILKRNEVYQLRRDLLLDGLRAAGLRAECPRATLYVWAQIPPGSCSEAFALDLLVQTGVAVAPGSFFGPAGEGYIRLSVTAPASRIRVAMARLGEYTTQRHSEP